MSFAYSQLPLDRCSNERKSITWLKNEFAKASVKICVINDGQCLFELAALKPLFLTKEQLPSLQLAQCAFLGKDEQNAYFAIDLNKLRFSCQEHILTIGQWQSLRQATAAICAFDATILALAKGLVHWHKSHQYCGLCGNISRAVEAGHARKCTECRNLTFPRTDPAVIMLVERLFADGVPRCLLARQASWPDGVYSTLAGFVDPGETLEMAVIREVEEETNIIAKNPEYVASQPWPFPASIMLGFVAEAVTEDIDTSQDSLEQAHWFSREQLQVFEVNRSVIASEGEQNLPQDNAQLGQFKMSSSDSISSYLIRAWLNKEIGKY
ncbi:NAD(+) diphosphatase [Litorilituus sediminis]|uniref:NAD(+) diphosphatase n=1 Tax=Litorilituus sediminis TaxID=718192 RepID=A0A4P6P7B0_9GAMM|nr:NAD(+) diphosphatase [Litorilituus sediminis]QBG37541.1 NAD(+) diphosphatase [Litorilituus sediminis]